MLAQFVLVLTSGGKARAMEAHRDGLGLTGLVACRGKASAPRLGVHLAEQLGKRHKEPLGVGEPEAWLLPQDTASQQVTAKA